MSPSLRQRVSIYPGQFMSGVIYASLGPLLNPILEELDISTAQAGFLSATFFTGEILGILLLNMRMAKQTLTRIAVAGALVQALGLLFGCLVARNLESMLVAYFMLGIGWSLVNTTGWMWVQSHVKEQTASATLFLILFFAAGMTITPVVLGVALANGVPWTWLVGAEGLLSLALALVFVALPLSDVPDRENIRIRQLRAVAAFNPLLLYGILAASFLYVGAEANLVVWLPKFQIDTFDVSDAWASLTSTFFFLAILIGRLVAIPAARRFYPSRLLVICGAGLAIFSVGIALAPTQWVCLVLATGAGFAASACFGLIGSYSGRFPAWHAGVVSSAFIVAGGVGGTILPYLTGPVVDAAGFRIGIALTAVPAIGCALVALSLRASSGESRRQAIRQTQT